MSTSRTESDGEPTAHPPAGRRACWKASPLNFSRNGSRPSSRSSDDAIISKDLNGIIQTWDRRRQAVFGYTAEEAVGKPVTILIPPERIDEAGDTGAH